MKISANILLILRNNMNMLIRYIIYGLIGLNMEIVWTGISTVSIHNRNLIGHTSIWMFFIYGAAVFIMEPIHNLIADQNWFVRGCVWTTVIFLIEFVSGMTLRAFHIEAWRYDGVCSVMGVIRLDYAPLWFIVGLCFEYVHKLLIEYGVGVK